MMQIKLKCILLSALERGQLCSDRTNLGRILVETLKWLQLGHMTLKLGQGQKHVNHAYFLFPLLMQNFIPKVQASSAIQLGHWQKKGEMPN